MLTYPEHIFIYPGKYLTKTYCMQCTVLYAEMDKRLYFHVVCKSLKETNSSDLFHNKEKNQY